MFFIDKLELYVNNNVDIFPVVSTIVNEGEYRSCCRTLDFTMLKNKTTVKIGDKITFKVNNYIQFIGIVTSKNLTTDNKKMNISCKDYGIYLKRNFGTYKFKNASPESIATRVARDFSIPFNWAYRLPTTITRNFININLYNIVMTAYTLNSNKKFCIQFEQGKMVVLERGAMSKRYILQDNLISVDATESIDNMVNTINIYNHEDKLIKTIQNANDRKLFGQFNDYIKLQKDDKKDYVKEANKKLQGIEQKISVGCLGDSSFTTGKATIIETPISNIKGKYFIDADTHKWADGIYTNKLILNFKSIMDEHEDGSLEESKNYNKTSSKKATSKKTKSKKKKDDTGAYSVYLNRL
ncbi:hypothetical protein DP124_12070 [Clostridium tetani]|uniref:XkdQ/YqbQ family protein n=1 Tax=Clostridium tetani TaxID=1513 RepID=UPI00100A5FCC|nr:hypothetical protein [Clostridium tetani]RXI50199.1 hypothetical protein DP124_12070 [Clostridium tetani]